jgi:C-terminal processing protease CtpA/Prc
MEQMARKIAYRRLSGLVIDVRMNGGGSGNTAALFAGHFFQRRVSFGVVQERVPGRTLRFRKRRLFVKPRRPFLSMPVALLIGVESLSANEYFIAGLIDNKRAIAIGETTGGSSGNPRKHTIPYGTSSFEVWVATWRYFRPNGKALEGIGIRQNLLARQTLEDQLRGNDVLLQYALKYLQRGSR